MSRIPPGLSADRVIEKVFEEFRLRARLRFVGGSWRVDILRDWDFFCDDTKVNKNGRMLYPAVAVVGTGKDFWAIARGHESDDSGSRASDIIAMWLPLVEKQITTKQRELIIATINSCFADLVSCSRFRNSLLIAVEDGHIALHRHSMFFSPMANLLDVPGSRVLQEFIAQESRPNQMTVNKLFYPDLAAFIKEDVLYPTVYKSEIVNFLFEAVWSSIEGHK
ncbi:MAG: hypothetical protein Q7R94_01825 [bacterium]|nr:hypothetical protein [bacterium]